MIQGRAMAQSGRWALSNLGIQRLVEVDEVAAMIRSVFLGSLLLASCMPGIETPRGATPNHIEVRHASSRGVLWGAALSLSDDGRLVSVEVSCDGEPYANAPPGDVITGAVFGARAYSYAETTCQDGLFELVVFTVPDGEPADVPGQYHPFVFYFDDREFVGADLRGAEHLNPPTINDINE
jgi:hypothetical protein